ncbi:PLP-dependent aminotransferase family protein [Desulfoluna spongiiphila]|uniref:Transcriptional regulator, GntR family n=1 Tax=Desulfoluna spongiiphila TaxID=419481 RepID=A0A1G5ENQ0_9BACT|nr:PLP-dependent aminotransferase family protein [Desulfoluna spongiiphila]SCY28421.1 transcriptional regulator, GntR family [Desulfoluna spongiiphila]VVS91228.1 transcription regulator hth gntr [Desulfoluna spongiiphila]
MKSNVAEKKGGQPLYEEVAGRLALMVREGTFRPGEKVPSIRAMSQRLKVSINTVKTAYGLLEDRRVIEARPQSGYYVCARLPAIPREPDVRRPLLNAAAVEAGEMVSRIMRDVNDPERVQFGAAIPDPAILPSEKLGRIMAAEVRRAKGHGTGYAMGSGLPKLRHQIARHMLKAGVTLAADEILITSGASEGVSLAMKVLCRPGDTVVTGAPVYFNFLQLFRELGLKVLEVPSSPVDGIHLDALERALSRNRVSACLQVTNFNNPLGVSLSEEKKKDLVALLARYQVPLVEDDINGDIAFDGRRPGVCKAYDKSGMVILCSSFSKTLAPGYRVGWMVSGRFRERMQRLKMVSSLATALPPQLAVAEFLANGGYEHHLRGLGRTCAQRVAAMGEMVGETFPEGTRVTRPWGGFTLWVEMPQAVDSMKLYAAVEPMGITVAPGALFSIGDTYQHYLRLNAAAFTPETRWALKAVGDAARELV